ncbi:transcription-repair coupling factor [Haloferula sp. A504]|uniref:transcription-repair coupling factor n=1 Tax=Haloferula sp. A504 TaxID=3373601 RepID=UPI0031C79839|nr:transcription-repair coupling factor [Verrucomicrobiaceae bacterium E54]
MPATARPTDLWLARAAGVPEFRKRLDQMVKGDGTIVFDHVEPAAEAWLIALVRHAEPRGRTWLLVPSPKHRERLAAELALWRMNASILPDPSLEISETELGDPEGEAARLELLNRASRAENFLMLASPGVFASPAPDPDKLRQRRLILSPGEQHDPATLTDILSDQGYEKCVLVQDRGQFAVRGGILDVFPWQSGCPLRLEFFDTEIESIREFEIDSQTSVRKLGKAELLLGEVDNDCTVEAYRRPDDRVIVLGESAVRHDLAIIEGSADPEAEEDFSTACFSKPLGAFEAGDFVLEDALRERFFKQLAEWHREDWKVGIVFSNRGEQERFEELVPDDLGFAPEFLRGELMESFTVPAAKIALLSSSEIFGRYRTPGMLSGSRGDTRRVTSARASLDEISEGDLVVHSEYGVGRFLGIPDGEEEITIEYRDGALLSVPVDQSHLVSRYVGIGGRAPQLSKLGGTGWRNTRKGAETAIMDYAARLLRIQAEREAAAGFAHPPDSRWMWEFENSFHFTETPDQRRAIEETKRDMESPRAMDRLICGDVGFGKTEVAIRAAFKAVTGGKQVALLCPTTVLAEQHWRTFRERMSDYPIRIDLLNRFRSPAESRETIRGVGDGSVDIVIGTHRLLSADIHFKDLGLVVVDEEQRFGVKHKERFKDLFRQIDVLTLSATPIPRTLYMALMGARDMSTIDTPPPNRIPVHTTVTPYDERLIREAVRRELRRDGQVFFLHNRVKSIDLMRRKLAELLPEARILVGHGQMEKDELEVVMRSFVRGEADILLATTIIETGIDIPNANTILIDRADRFGLADLYQLRGRVGRAGEQAYAILLLPRELVTQGDARKRIHAIKQYTALGSGFKIAMRDLEIRGAGNLLGTKQSGQIAAVGFGLYCQLLRQSIDRLQGRDSTGAVDTAFRSDFIAFSQAEFQRGSADVEMLPAYLPHSWLTETRLRVSAYREMAECLDEEELNRLSARWADRFGRLPDEARQLLDVTRLRLLGAGRGVESIEIKGQRLMLQRNGDYIMLEGRRFPRLKQTKPAAKLREAIELLRNL